MTAQIIYTNRFKPREKLKLIFTKPVKPEPPKGQPC